MSEKLRRIASDEPTGPTYRVAAPKTRGEARLTAGVSVEPGTTYGFFTDSTLCIGCKACETACKQWNRLPMDHFGLKATSYDNTGQLGATTWRHVQFIEEIPKDGETGRWLFLSDVCKHCEHAGCLEACPTGAIIRTEFGSVVIQADVCNGCQYCVPSCPFGVFSIDEDREAGADPAGEGKGERIARKCTLCYDRLKAGLEPACAKSCPTDSIQFGPVESLRDRAQARLEALRARGETRAYLYGIPGGPGASGGIGSLHCFFLLTERPEAYNLPATPELPSRRTVRGSATTIVSALGWAALAVATIRGASRVVRRG
jgi:formate dehydrogenase iron-sulfur subunit